MRQVVKDVHTVEGREGCALGQQGVRGRQLCCLVWGRGTKPWEGPLGERRAGDREMEALTAHSQPGHSFSAHMPVLQGLQGDKVTDQPVGSGVQVKLCSAELRWRMPVRKRASDSRSGRTQWWAGQDRPPNSSLRPLRVWTRGQDLLEDSRDAPGGLLFWYRGPTKRTFQQRAVPTKPRVLRLLSAQGRQQQLMGRAAAGSWPGSTSCSVLSCWLVDGGGGKDRIHPYSHSGCLSCCGPGPHLTLHSWRAVLDAANL